MGIRWLTLLCLLCACSAEVVDPHAGPAWLDVGAGQDRFEPLEDGDELTLAAGGQGGWHLWLGVHVGGIGPGPVEIRVHAEPEGWDGPVEDGWWQIPVEPVAGEPFCEQVGVVAVLSAAECFRDHPLRLDVRVSSEDGRSASDSLVIVPRAPESPEMEPCED